MERLKSFHLLFINFPELKLYILFSTNFLFQKKDFCYHLKWLIIYLNSPNQNICPGQIEEDHCSHNSPIGYNGPRSSLCGTFFFTILLQNKRSAFDVAVNVLRPRVLGASDVKILGVLHILEFS